MASLRRLAKDHAAIQSVPPPNYLFPNTEDGSSWSDDLTQLVVLVTGADGTPYAKGLWRLHLKIPNDYPKNPPKATFKTRIYHPNVDEKTGAVCLETLKRDWDPKLTLKDILVTISCLLIQPNPDSALNAAAGALIQDNYDAFSTQAQLMTKIHAPIPEHLLVAVQEAKRRGEEADQEVVPSGSMGQEHSEADDTKENDPRKASETSTCPRRSSQSHVRGKRPLSELPTPEEADMNASADVDTEPKRKSPRMARTDASPTSTSQITPDGSDEPKHVGVEQMNTAADKERHKIYAPPVSGHAATRKGSGTTTKRVAPRVGIRRL
ncbi:hypothetical protein H2200_006073 [Cladophialophora chaetospira]|uniref:UBC core domain-containing protein n=1 Tax=Cladophialophora chaetospira TaxID=386627 RepID=A0AA38XAV6_9EURO|nr:hypothetical protein H2200_006073 [Cladophialophora chaetospira]